MTTHPSSPEAQAQVASTCVVRFFQTMRQEPGSLSEPPPVLARLRTAALAAGLLAGLAAQPSPATAGDTPAQLRLRVVAAAAIQGMIADRNGVLLDLDLSEAAGRTQAALLDKGLGSTSGWASRDRSIQATTGYVAKARMPLVTWSKEFREPAVPGAGRGEECAVLLSSITASRGLEGKASWYDHVATLFCRDKDGWRLVDMGDWARIHQSLKEAGAAIRSVDDNQHKAPIRTGTNGEPCLETSEPIRVGSRTETAYGIACRSPS